MTWRDCGAILLDCANVVWRAGWKPSKCLLVLGLGAVPAAILGGICTLGVVAGWMWAFPSLRKVDQFEEAAAEAKASGTRPPADA